MIGYCVVGGLWQVSWGCTGCTASVIINVSAEVVLFSFAEQWQLLQVLSLSALLLRSLSLNALLVLLHAFFSSGALCIETLLDGGCEVQCN
jgi:hypothetical protein